MARINFYSPHGAFEPWDWRNPTEKGIGGSETAFAELAWRLARRGHRVTCYAPIPDDCPGKWEETVWRHYSLCTFTEPGLWVIHRSPGAADLFEKRPDQEFWMLAQDVLYSEGTGGAYTEERAAKFSRIIALCEPHREHLELSYPFLAPKLSIGSNGIKSDAIMQHDPLSLSRNPPRHPKRLIWASSPDRGLEALLLIFARAREFEPELELRVFYGFDNWDAFIAKNPGCPQAKMRARIVALLDQPGVTWHGRIPQPRLHEEFLQAGIWAYPSTFCETSCIACMEAQALGAIPVTNHYWAVRDNVQYGVKIPGDPMGDALVRAKYVQEIVALAGDLPRQDSIRRVMQPWALGMFDWEREVDRYERWMSEGSEGREIDLARREAPQQLAASP